MVKDRLVSPAKRRRSPAIAIAIGIGALACVLFAFWLFCGRAPEPLTDAGQNLLQAMQKRDAGGILRYIQAEELAALGGDKDAVKKFLEDFVFPELAGFEQSGDIEFIPNEGAGSLAVIQHLTSGDSRATDVSVQMIGRPSGTSSESLVHSLFLSALAARYERSDEAINGIVRQQKRVAAMRDVMGRLDSLPLKGIPVARPGGRYEFQSWQAYYEGAVSRLRRMEDEMQKGQLH